MNENTAPLYFSFDRDGSISDVVGFGSAARRVSRIACESMDWNNRHYVDSVIVRSHEARTLQRPVDPTNAAEVPPTRAPRRPDTHTRPKRQITKAPARAMAAPPAAAEEDDDDETRIWDIIHRLDWQDRHEMFITQDYLEHRLDRKTRAYLLHAGAKYAKTLARVFEAARIPEYQSLVDSDQKNNILFHIIGKGREFYEFTMQCPDIATYLFDNKWQPLYTMLVADPRLM